MLGHVHVDDGGRELASKRLMKVARANVAPNCDTTDIWRMDPTNAIPDPAALDHAKRLLAYHFKHGNGFAETVNRLLREQIEREPGIAEAGFVAQYETWPLDRLVALRRLHDRRNPKRVNQPVLIIHFEGAMHLVDGTNRINVWEEAGTSGPHSVILLRAQDGRV